MNSDVSNLQLFRLVLNKSHKFTKIKILFPIVKEWASV